MDKKSKIADKRRLYNSDKTSIQVLKDTHKKLKDYCESNKLKMKDFLNNIILNSINN
jgi:hypothetical protein